MALFNRIVAALLWLFLLITITILAVAPVGAIQQLQRFLGIALTQIQAWQVTNGDNFIIAQATIGISAVLLFGILFAKMMLPGIMNLIPSFTLAWKLGILDTPLPVILFCAGTSQPFWVFVMRTFVAQQPRELFESMRIDGANEFQIFRALALPLLRPMIALMSINVFVSVWNDYIWPLVTIPTFDKRPLTVGLAYLTQAHPGDYGMLTAGYVLAALPLLILFLLAMRQFIEGLTAGAIKL